MTSKVSTVGSARTVLVFGHGSASKATTATVVVRVKRRAITKRRLSFAGPVRFDPKIRRHIREIVLVVVDCVTARLQLHRDLFEISVATPAAASAANLDMTVAGFSVDAAVFLAMLSAATRIPLRQDVVVTGHLASPGGEIRPVASIPAKIQAAKTDTTVKRIVLPRVDADISLRMFLPRERERMRVAIIAAKEHFEICPVQDVSSLLEAAVTDESVVLGSLCSGFFSVDQSPNTRGNAPDHAAQFLLKDKEESFWRVLEVQLMECRSSVARQFLMERLRYQLLRDEYPQGFGYRLHQLMQSLPPAKRRLGQLFPLIPLAECLELGKTAGERDYDDVRKLIETASGTPIPERRHATPGKARREPTARDAIETLDAVLQAIGAETLAREIGLPIDAARGAYVLEEVTTDSYQVFLDTISAFFLFLIRHLNGTERVPDGAAVEAEAADLVSRAFRNDGGYEAARAEAQDGVNGGLRFVLDAMTQQYKIEQNAKRVSRVFRAALDPMDWEARVAFMAVLMERLKDHLPADILAQPPDRFARRHEPIVRAYVESQDSLKQLLRRL